MEPAGVASRVQRCYRKRPVLVSRCSRLQGHNMGIVSMGIFSNIETVNTLTPAKTVVARNSSVAQQSTARMKNEFDVEFEERMPV